MITKVKGVTFDNDDGSSRKEIIASMSENDEIMLVRDPFNPFDSNAIKVCVKKDGRFQQIGFVDKTLASELSPKMKEGWKCEVRVESCGIYMDRPYCEIELINWVSNSYS